MNAGAVEARLRGELARLLPLNPFEVLGVAPSAGPETIRAAFLAATKRFHPTLFGRDSAEVQELATEVFLVIRRAYALLSDEEKRRGLRERLVGAGAGAGLAFAPASPLSGTPPLGVPTTPAPPRIPAMPSRPVAPPKGKGPATQPPSGPPPRTPPTQPPSGSAPRTPPTQPPSGPAPRTPPTQPPSGPMPRPAPLAPHSGPAPTRIAEPTPRPVKPVGPAAGPPAKSRSGNTTDVQAILDAAKARRSRFEDANRLLAEGRHGAARELLHQIVTEEPQNRRYRVRLALARALESRAAKRYDEAVRELERALGLDPDNPELTEVLRTTRELREASRGLISRLLGR